MQKIGFLFFLCFFLLGAQAQITTTINWTEKTKLIPKDVIYYNINKKLTWADFIGIPNRPYPIAAITTSGFGYTCSMQSTNGKGTINVNIYCFFSKPKSWVKKDKKTAYILTHEQHHFDATYIAAKDFIAKVKAATLTVDNMNEVISAIYKECYAALNKMQEDYDTETNNGRLTEKQKQWNTFFDQKLVTIIN
jgi:hypothetical protein